MPRLATGNVYERRGKWFARLTIGPNKRQSFMLAKCTTKESAMAKQAALADMAAKLRVAGRADIAREIIKRAASRDGKAFEEVRNAVDMIAAGKEARLAKMPTFQELCERWTGGELAREYRDHVKLKRSVRTDIAWLNRYVYPLVGDVPVDAFKLDHAETVMRSLPARLSASSRRAIAQLIHRICGLAVFPMRLIDHNPLPRGFVQHKKTHKAKGWLYPDEDKRLLCCARVPLCWRVFYGFLHREGMRRSEAFRMTWSDVDLERGAVMLDKNKTDEPRAWALSPGVAIALSAWRERCAKNGLRVDGGALVFVDEQRLRKGEGLAHRETGLRYRKHLGWAGIDRPELFVSSEARMAIRLHDTRATFITLALANGKTESWVQDRTGHRSSDMINRYRRVARTAAELGLGECLPLDEAIPEFWGRNGETAAEKAPRRGRGGQEVAKKGRGSRELTLAELPERNCTPPPRPPPRPPPPPQPVVPAPTWGRDVNPEAPVFVAGGSQGGVVPRSFARSSPGTVRVSHRHGTSVQASATVATAASEGCFMSLRPWFEKLLGPSALVLLFAMSASGCGGCSGNDATVTCDANGANCVICDGYGCHPADPHVGSGGEGGTGQGGAGGQGGTGGNCDPNVTTCGCASDTQCPAGTLCLEGLCLVGCNHSYECGAGNVCVNGKCEAGCDAQTPCDTGLICKNGVCVADPLTACPQTPCAAGEACVDGVCEPSCKTNADCPAGDICDSTSGGCIPDPSPVPGCGPGISCPVNAQCAADGYCHYPCGNLTACKLVDNRFVACDQGICKTDEEVNPECSLDKPCPAGKDCISNKCL